MDEQSTSNPNPTPKQKAQAIWQRLCGCFGADAVERKFGPTPPPEWVAMIGRLKDHELERGMRRLVYSGAAAPPSLPQFVRLCRTVGDAPDVDDGPRVPALPTKPADWQGDRWDIAANRHLLAYIVRRMTANPHAYGRPASYLAMRATTSRENPHADAPEFVRAVEILVAYTRAWAQDMREWADPQTGQIGRPPVAAQQAAWEDCMARAEADIATQRRAA